MISRATHTFAVLEVSAATYAEISGKLRAAAYDHCFINKAGGKECIAMHGIALQVEEVSPPKMPEPKKEKIAGGEIKGIVHDMSDVEQDVLNREE